MEEITPDRARLQEFLERWSRLAQDASAPGTVLVVEGVKDREALDSLGLKASIERIHAGRSLAAFSHAVGLHYRRAILLTDWDRAGGTLARRLTLLLRADGIEVDLVHRQEIGRATRGEIVHVEGLATWILHLVDAVGTAWATELARWHLPVPAADSARGPTG
ncbi:MAG: hypothetical protein QXG65_03630 [Thermoplasmata archaeon]